MGKTFGFLGTGNMGSALARAAAKAVDPKDILLANRTPEKAQLLASELGCRVAGNQEAAQICDFIFLGVKPQMMPDLLKEIAPVLSSRTDSFVLVSMAAGMTMTDIRRLACGKYPVIRIMPNTPVSIGKGVILYDCTPDVSPEDLDTFRFSLSRAGLLDPLAEHLIDAGSAVSGCGPAFVDLFIEALADGGVAGGLPRSKALTYAAQMVLGSAALLLETGSHPGELKDAVCSPGGSTIAGVRALEQRAFRAAVMEAVDAAIARTREMAK